jgi:transposase
MVHLYSDLLHLSPQRSRFPSGSLRTESTTHCFQENATIGYCRARAAPWQTVSSCQTLPTTTTPASSAFRVIRRNGYADAQITDILAEAGAETRVFYRHFASKDVVLREPFHENAARSWKKRVDEIHIARLTHTAARTNGTDQE